LLDEEAILACSAYVDLNPIRAAMAHSIETSKFTSAKLRFEAAKQQTPHPSTGPDCFLAPIMLDSTKGSEGPKPSRYKKRCSDKGVLPLSNLDYLQLLDLTARMQRSDKRGYYATRFATAIRAVGNRYRAVATVDEGFRSHVQPGSGQGAKRSRCKESQDEASFLSEAVGTVTTRVWSTSILVAKFKQALHRGPV
jgi:hypothetical protein